MCLSLPRSRSLYLENSTLRVESIISEALLDERKKMWVDHGARVSRFAVVTLHSHSTAG